MDFVEVCPMRHHFGDAQVDIFIAWPPLKKDHIFSKPRSIAGSQAAFGELVLLSSVNPIIRFVCNYQSAAK